MFKKSYIFCTGSLHLRANHRGDIYFSSTIVWLIFQIYHVLQGGSVPPASNSRMPPLPHEPAGFYNDRGATVDIPLDSTKVPEFPLNLLVFWDSYAYQDFSTQENHIVTKLFHCRTFLLIKSVTAVICFLFHELKGLCRVPLTVVMVILFFF